MVNEFMAPKYRQVAYIATLTCAGLLSACSKPASGPQWQCAPYPDTTPKDERLNKCDVRLEGQDIVLRLAKKKEDLFLLVSHKNGGQVKTRVTIEPRRGEAITLEANAQQKQCNRIDCIIPLDAQALKALKKNESIEVELTRATIRPQQVRHKKFEQVFTARNLGKMLKEAGE